MNLTLPELALLKATPFPYDSVQRNPAKKKDIYHTACTLLQSNFEERIALKILDGLEELRLIERVSVGFFRRTFEGEALLKEAGKALRTFSNRISGRGSR